MIIRRHSAQLYEGVKMEEDDSRMGGGRQILGSKITNIEYAKITRIRQKESVGYRLERDPHYNPRELTEVSEIVLKATTMRIERFSGIESCKTRSNSIKLRFGDEGSLIFLAENGSIALYADGCFIGNADGFFLEGKAEVSLVLARPKFRCKRPDNRSKWNALQPLVPLVFVLIWSGLNYDQLSKNTILSIALILGVLVILYGGILSIGKLLEIRKDVRHDD
jgi:hypothetical protein